MTYEAGIAGSNPVSNMEDLHRVLLMIATDIDEFCVENDIQYYLMGGTALGAMRHSGFIPWDDDFDIFMDRRNYLKFIEACKLNLNQEKYYLEKEDTENWPLFFSKIKLNNTIYKERDNEKEGIHIGIYIDVICLHNTYSNTYLRYLQFLAARMLSAFALAKRGYETHSIVKRIALAAGHVLGCTPLKDALLRFVRALDQRDTEMVGHFFGRAPFAETSFPRRFLGAGRRVPFADTCLPVPENVEGYLTSRFGPNYMAMPDKKTRDAFPSHLLYCDLGPYS